MKDKIIIDNDTELDLDDLSEVSGGGGKSGGDSKKIYDHHLQELRKEISGKPCH